MTEHDQEAGASVSRIGRMADDSEDLERAKLAEVAQKAARDWIGAQLRKLGIGALGIGAGVGGTLVITDTPAEQASPSPVTVVTDPSSGAPDCRCVCKSTEETRILLDWAETFADFIELPEGQRPRPPPPPER